jgi:hypothetical protein
MKDWDDNNRFNQTGYSGATLFPKEENYRNKRLYLEDLEKAEAREVLHQEFIDDLRMDYEEDRRRDALDIQEEYILDDEMVNEGWV